MCLPPCNEEAVQLLTTRRWFHDLGQGWRSAKSAEYGHGYTSVCPLQAEQPAATEEEATTSVPVADADTKTEPAAEDGTGEKKLKKEKKVWSSSSPEVLAQEQTPRLVAFLPV